MTTAVPGASTSLKKGSVPGTAEPPKGFRLELQRLRVRRGEQAGADLALREAPEREEVAVLAVDRPLGRERDLLQRLGRVKQVLTRRLRLARVHKELDAVGILRQPGRKDELHAVRVAGVGADLLGCSVDVP